MSKRGGSNMSNQAGDTACAASATTRTDVQGTAAAAVSHMRTAGVKQTRESTRATAADAGQSIESETTPAAAKRARLISSDAPDQAKQPVSSGAMAPLGTVVAMRAAAHTGAEAIASAQATRLLLGVRVKRTSPQQPAPQVAVRPRAPMAPPELAEPAELCEADLVAALEGKLVHSPARVHSSTVATGASATPVNAAAAPATPSVAGGGSAAAAVGPNLLAARAMRSVPAADVPVAMTAPSAPSTPPRPTSGGLQLNGARTVQGSVAPQSHVSVPHDLTAKQLEAALAGGVHALHRHMSSGAAQDSSRARKPPEAAGREIEAAREKHRAATGAASAPAGGSAGIETAPRGRTRRGGGYAFDACELPVSKLMVALAYGKGT